MRPLEIILLVTLSLTILHLVAGRKSPSLLNYLALIPIFLAPIQILIEGYRWQMLPAYLLSVIALIAIIRRLQSDHSGARRRRPWLSRGLLLLGLGVALILPITLPVPRLPQPDGPYAIGTAAYHLIDPSRPETQGDSPSGQREVMMQVWYPATDVEDYALTPYIDHLDLAREAVAEQLGLPAFLLSHLGLVRTHAHASAPVAPDGPFPVVFFVHGLGGIRMQNTALAEKLASRGFVVASIDHTFGGAVTVFPDGRVALYHPPDDDSRSLGTILMETWSADLTYALTVLGAFDADSSHLLAGALDLDHLGVSGHSTGGGTTYQFCVEDGRCRAAALLDSWLTPLDAAVLADEFRAPILFLNTPNWLGPDNKARGEAMFARTVGDSYRVYIRDTVHFDFADIPLFSPVAAWLGVSGPLNGAYTVGIINDYTAAFFEQYLADRPSPLLNGTASPFPEVEMTRR